MREASCVKNMLSRQCLSNKRGYRVIDFTTTECVLFPELFAKPAVLQFDQRQGSSDGGAILLKAARAALWIDRRPGWVPRRQAASRQGRSSAEGASRAARILDCLRLSGRQRLGPSGVRSHSQDVAGSRSGYGT